MWKQRALYGQLVQLLLGCLLRHQVAAAPEQNGTELANKSVTFVDSDGIESVLLDKLLDLLAFIPPTNLKLLFCSKRPFKLLYL